MALAKKQQERQRPEDERSGALRALSEGVSDRVLHLRSVSLFADISATEDALFALAKVMERREFKPDEPIIREGESGSEMFLLIDGQASIYKSTPDGDPYKVAILQSAQHPFFGEGGLLDSDARSATIKADTGCSCLVLSRAAFEEFSGTHPQWALPISLRIARAVMARLRKTNNDLMLLYNALVAEIRGS